MIVFKFFIILSAFLEVFTYCDNVCSLNITEDYLNILYKPVKQCSKGTEFSSWSFSNFSTLKTRFPIDSEIQMYVRKVSNVLFSVVKPAPLDNVKLVAVSDEALVNILNLNPSVKHDPTFVKFVAGNWVHPHGVYLAHRYGGHQVN